jgi:two-component system LytT family sensor kinase
MDESSVRDTTRAGEPPPVSVHFVNNVLAAAASYIEDDPDQAREVLAELSAFLTYRLRRPPREVTLSQEIDHVGVYVRLEQARFPGRIAATLPASDELPATAVEPAAIQAGVADVLGRWLGQRPGPCRMTLRSLPGEPSLELAMERPGAPEATETIRLPLSAPATTIQTGRVA